MPIGKGAIDFRIVVLDTGTDRPGLEKATYAATNTPGGRRVLMHNLIMGLDTMADERPKGRKRRHRGTT